MSRPRVNAVSGLGCSSCGMGEFGTNMAWGLVAVMLAWIFIGTLRVRSRREA